MEPLLRRRQTTLGILGAGVIVFGIWTVVKTVLFWLTQRTGPFGAMPAAERVGLSLLVGIPMLADLGLRFYIGHSARAESAGAHRSAFYLVLTGVLIALNGMAVGFTSFVLIAGGADWLDTLIELFIDLTSCVTMADLLITGIGFRSLRKRLGM